MTPSGWTATAPSTEFQIVQSPRIAYSGRRFDHLILRIRDPQRGELYRVVTFRELAYIPMETREDPDVLGKQIAVLRGLYAAHVDFVYAAMGVFRPEHLGVGQFYGAAAEAYTVEEAAQEAKKRMNAILAEMANFPHMRLQPPAPERIGLLLARIERLPRVIAVLGHPDPRLARKGMGRDGSLGEVDDELLSQQGEMLLRGLAKIRQDFVFTVTAHHIRRGWLADALVKMSRWSSVYASRQRGALGASFSIAIPLAAALGSNTGASHGSGQTHATSRADSVAETHGTSEAHSWGHGVSHSETRGEADTSSVAVTNGVVHSQGGGVTHSSANTSSWAHTTSHSQTDSVADTRSWAHTTSHSTSVAHSSGVSHSVSDGISSNWSAGQSSSVGVNQTQSSNWSQSDAVATGVTETSSSSHTETGSVAVAQGHTETQGGATTFSTAEGSGWQAGGNVSVEPIGIGVSGGGNVNHTESTTSGTVYSGSQSDSNTVTVTAGGSDTTGHATANSTVVTHGSSHGGGVSTGVYASVGQSSSVGGGSSHTVTSGSFQSATRGESWGTSDTRGGTHTVGHATTRGTADTRGGAHTTGVARSSTWGLARSHSVTTGRAHTVSRAESIGESWSEGRTVGRTDGWGRSHTDGQSRAVSIARAGTRGYMGGLGAGIVPGVAITRSWQSEDDVAIRLTEITRQLGSLLNLASAEGGFYTTVTLAVDDEGLKPAMATVTQAFHGANVPTPVQPVVGDNALRPFMLAFRPSLQPDGDPFGIGLWTKWGTLHTVPMLAAFTAPNLFEEGAAMTVQEKIPSGIAFYPLMEGDVILGHQVSPETDELTTAPLKLARDRHFHTAFVGDTGYGKTVAAERLVYETTLRWKMRTIVLDFGAGWRKMLNAPGLEGRVDVRQLSPGGVRPLRWNPLQIGRNILPEVQWRAFCDIFGAISKAGVRRQVAEIREALRQVYLNAGVLVDDPDLSAEWQVVRPGEDALLGVPQGSPLTALTPEQKQRLAVERSRIVGLADLYVFIEKKLDTVPPRDNMLRGVLEGILFRLHPLVQGAAARQYAAGLEAVDINEVVPGDWGIAVLEGGAFLDEFSKAFLLGWTAWHIYTDAVVQRTKRARTEPARIQIVFEEANKILSGVATGDDEGGRATTAEQFASMWRDSRKYGIYLHLITQSPSLIPPGIMSSSNNLFVAQVKNRRDQEIVLGMLHKSPMGFTDEPWRRFLATLPKARSVVKLGYTFNRSEMEPVYVRPKLLDVREPTDEEIIKILGHDSL